MPCRATLSFNSHGVICVEDILVPKRYNQLGKSPYTDVVTVTLGEPKVCDLDLAAIVHQKVGRLEIPMQDPVFVAAGDCGEQLEQERLDLGWQESVWHDRQQALKKL